MLWFFLRWDWKEINWLKEKVANIPQGRFFKADMCEEGVYI